MSFDATLPTIPIAHVEQALMGLRRLHYPDRAVLMVLRKAGIAPSLLDAPLSRVTQAQYTRLLLTLRRVTRDELWGMMPRRLKPGAFALGCRWMLRGPSLRDAIQAGSAYYHQCLDDFTPRLYVADRIASLRLIPASPASDVDKGHAQSHAPELEAGNADRLTCRLADDAYTDPCLAFAQRSFSFFAYGLLCWLVGRRIPLLFVNYPCEQQPAASDAQRLFQAPLQFQAHWTGFGFDARWLSLPVVQSPQSLAEFLRSAPSGLLVRYRDQTSLADRVRRTLRRQLDDPNCTLERVAQSLSMTPQTLRRHLQAEGTGFQTIKDDLRRDVAIELLAQPQLTLIDIGQRLGFSEASTFHRAFKAWTGLAPGAYRQSQLASPGS